MTPDAIETKEFAAMLRTVADVLHNDTLPRNESIKWLLQQARKFEEMKHFA